MLTKTILKCWQVIFMSSELQAWGVDLRAAQHPAPSPFSDRSLSSVLLYSSLFFYPAFLCAAAKLQEIKDNTVILLTWHLAGVLLTWFAFEWFLGAEVETPVSVERKYLSVLLWLKRNVKLIYFYLKFCLHWNWCSNGSNLKQSNFMIHSFPGTCAGFICCSEVW